MSTCTQCGVRYGQDLTFCPRCGSTAKGASVPAALDVARRRDPERRRVQASGVVLAAVGGLLVLLFLPVLALSQSLTSATLDDLITQENGVQIAGGTLALFVTNATAPAANLPVHVTNLEGEGIANGTTDAQGRFRANLGDSAFVKVSLQTEAGNYTRKAVALEGSTTTVRLDLAEPMEDSTWSGVRPLLIVLRVLLAVFTLVAGLLFAAGICALRLKGWSFAVLGATIGLVPLLLLLVATFNVGLLLLFLVVGFPLLFIARGRRHFAR